jgi:hypothetical protein
MVLLSNCLRYLLARGAISRYCSSTRHFLGIALKSGAFQLTSSYFFATVLAGGAAAKRQEQV